jgi:hypothetical protein
MAYSTTLAGENETQNREITSENAVTPNLTPHLKM